MHKSSWSRFSPDYDCVFLDPELLSTFTVFLQLHNKENLFRFWLETKGAIKNKQLGETLFSGQEGGVQQTEQQLASLEDKLFRLSENQSIILYKRYLSRSAIFPLNIPTELIATALATILEDPSNCLAFLPCLTFAEHTIKHEVFADFLKSSQFDTFCLGICTDMKLLLSDVLYDDTLISLLVEFVSGKPSATWLIFILTIDAYKKEATKMKERIIQKEADIPAPENTEKLEDVVGDAATICARFLSPASDSFIGLLPEECRQIIDLACSTTEPNMTCFDEAYATMYTLLEKFVLQPFQSSSVFTAYRNKRAATVHTKEAIQPTRRQSNSISLRATNLSQRQIASSKLVDFTARGPISTRTSNVSALQLGYIDQLGNFHSSIAKYPSK